MKKNQVKLLEIMVRLNEKGWQITIVELLVNDNEKSYSSKDRRISKDKVMKANESIILNCHQRVSFVTYCTPEQEPLATRMLVSEVRALTQQYKDETDRVYARTYDITAPVKYKTKGAETTKTISI